MKNFNTIILIAIISLTQLPVVYSLIQADNSDQDNRLKFFHLLFFIVSNYRL